MAILIGSKMRSKIVEHPVKPFAINLRAQVLIRTNPRKLGLVTGRIAVGNVVRLEFEQDLEVEMRESGIWGNDHVIRRVSFLWTRIEGQ